MLDSDTVVSGTALLGGGGTATVGAVAGDDDTSEPETGGAGEGSRGIAYARRAMIAAATPPSAPTADQSGLKTTGPLPAPASLIRRLSIDQL